MSGLIFDIQRFCAHDGPGIRTVVFMKGCPLRCGWCHNPEGRSGGPELAFYANKCIKCGRCIEVCPRGDGDCLVCGACAEVCPSEAKRIVGRMADVSEVVETVMRDERFYGTSGGGVTLCGGEPLFQPKFALSLLKRFKKAGLHTALETSGFAPCEVLSDVCRHADLVLYDLKVVDQAKHLKFCGVRNDLILANARLLSESGAEILFRTPIIPGINDSPEDMRMLNEFISSLPNAHPHELMPYHQLGAGKYEALGMEDPLARKDG